MTANLFVIANVKQLRTDGSFRILLPFFRTSWYVGVLKSAIFKFSQPGWVWHDFGGPSEFRGGGGRLNTPNPPSVHHCNPIFMKSMKENRQNRSVDFAVSLLTVQTITAPSHDLKTQRFQLARRARCYIFREVWTESLMNEVTKSQSKNGQILRNII